MGLQFSVSGRCNVSFEQAESAASRKAAVDTQNVELYARIHNKTTTVGRSVKKVEIMLTFLHYKRTSLRVVLHLFL